MDVRLLPLILLAALGASTACEEQCGRESNAGGGEPGIEVGVHVRVSPSALLGESAQRDAAEVLGLDGRIVEQTDAAQPMDLLIGAGKTGIEAHSVYAALPEAQKALEKWYDLEPLMLRHVRIKPAGDRARCMFVHDRVVCASGDARLGRATFEVDKWVLVRDAGTEEPFSVTVVKPELFGDHVWPLAVSHLERAMKRALTSQELIDVLTTNAKTIGALLAKARIVGDARGDVITLTADVAWRIPAGYRGGAGAPRLKPLAGYVGLSWFGDELEHAPHLAPFREHLQASHARVMRIRDGVEISLYELSTEDPDAVARLVEGRDDVALSGTALAFGGDAEARTAAAKAGFSGELGTVAISANVDLALIGGTGHVDVAMYSAGDATKVTAQMKRATFLSLVHVLAAGAPPGGAAP